jgi:hypothetical protein
MSEPSPNGRLNNGRFGIGNSGGPGNPFSLQVGKLRSTLLNAVTEDDLKTVVTKLVELAKGGNLAAMKLLLDRCCGKSFVDRLPNPKPPTSGLPTHDDNGVPLTFEQKKAWVLRRYAHLREDAGQTEKRAAEHEVDGDAERVAS